VVTVSRTVPAHRAFVEQGGTLIAIGDSTAVAAHFRLGVNDVTRGLAVEQYFIPGSVLRMSVDPTTPLAYGFEPEVDVFFDNSPSFRLEAGGVRHQAEESPRRVAWFASDAPLRSGWAWGQRHLRETVAVVDAPLGAGRVLLFGPQVTFRAQPHGTFKFLFNGIYYPHAADARLD
jgi:hypothetical protein